VLGLLLTACAAPSDDGAADDTTDTDTPGTTDTDTGTPGAGRTCTSGETWKGGDRESPLMHPGRACFECHTQRREGPRDGVAGTVFTGAHEPDDCNGAEGVTVEIRGDDGNVTTYTTNAAGNFVSSWRDPIVFPITAKVIVGDQVREMLTKQESGDCNSCHTVEGANAAPGRIRVP
jgi:hypothetical protein